MDDKPRTPTPVWVWILGLGLGALVLWWLIGVVFRTLVWGVKTLVLAAIVGAVIYAVLSIMGKRPGAG